MEASDNAQVRLRTVFASMLGLWLCYFLLATLRGTMVGLELQGDMLWRRALVSLAGVAVTTMLWLVLRLCDDRSLAAKIAVALIAAMPGALLIAQVNQWVFEPLEASVEQKLGAQRGISLRRDEAGNLLVDVPQEKMHQGVAEATAQVPRSVIVSPAPTNADRWSMIFDIALMRYFLLLAWAALYFALLAVEQARSAERREERFRSAANAAELRSLRYQVNPHFLFNTLNSLSALVMTGKGDRAEEMIQTMSRFYRHSLADDPTADVALEDEIALQQLYLDIEAVRFPDRLRTRIDLPPQLAGLRVPGMILQPLVENSVKYGVSTSAKPVTIAITADEEYDRLALTVSDDGPGKGGGEGGFGIGLANVRDRLQARFGNAAQVASGPRPDGGYATELRIPITRHG